MNQNIKFHDLKNPVELARLEFVIRDLYSRVNQVIRGTAAPTITPGKIGDEFLDVTHKKFYKAFGTASSADWIIQN